MRREVVMKSYLIIGAVTICIGSIAFGADSLPLPDAKPVPLMQVVPLPNDQVSVQRYHKEITRYHYGTSLKRPFLFPVRGDCGISLTRMGHPHDPVTHSHHNSLWISHNSVNGESFWADHGTGTRIVHEKVLDFVDGGKEAAISVANLWISKAGTKLLREKRTMRFIDLGGDKRILRQFGDYMIVFDLTFTALEDDVTIGKTPFGMIGVRMAKTIGVHDGGGMIRNAEGDVNEKKVFRKKTRWVDYSGQIRKGVCEGITLMDHPENPNHPAPFHVRNDGWMGACLTLHKKIVITHAQPLHIVYGVYVHNGIPKAAAIEEKWKLFADGLTK